MDEDEAKQSRPQSRLREEDAATQYPPWGETVLPQNPSEHIAHCRLAHTPSAKQYLYCCIVLHFYVKPAVSSDVISDIRLCNGDLRSDVFRVIHLRTRTRKLRAGASKKNVATYYYFQKTTFWFIIAAVSTNYNNSRKKIGLLYTRGQNIPTITCINFSRMIFVQKTENKFAQISKYVVQCFYKYLSDNISNNNIKKFLNL